VQQSAVYAHDKGVVIVQQGAVYVRN